MSKHPMLRAASLLALLAVAPAVCAQSTYPTRPVRIIAPTSPGSGSDLIARILAQGLSDRLGRQVIVENRTGAGTMIGGEHVARSAPDGHTLLMGVSTLAINPAMYKTVPYDALRDFAPITHAVTSSNVLVINPSLPVRTLKEFVAFVRARPNQVNFASAGFGTNPHLAMELLANMAQIRMVHIPYQGDAPSIVDLLAGHVAVTISPVPRGVPHVRAGRLRALGVTSAERVPTAKDIPTIAEAGLPGYEAVQWYGLLAPAGTPTDIVNRLHKESVAVLRSPEGRERLAELFVDVVASTPEQFAAFIKSETLKWGNVAKAVGVVRE